MPSALAAAWDRSISLLVMNGPRSLTITSTDRLFVRLVTRTREGKGSVRCAAVSALGLKRDPIAVRCPDSHPYQDATPLAL